MSGDVLIVRGGASFSFRPRALRFPAVSRYALPALLLLGACGGDPEGAGRPGVRDSSDLPAPVVGTSSCDPGLGAPLIGPQVTLAEAYAPYFKLGVAVGSRVSSGRDPLAAELAAQQYNRATPENAFKWQSLQPREGQFDFTQAEEFLSFAESHAMEVHGHTIVWHQQVPAWVFEAAPGAELTRELLLARLGAHMSALAERLGARVQYWDVVNEAFNDDGSLRSSPWRTIIGPDYLEQAFMLADRYFPNAKLVYNDFGMESAGKRDAVVQMVRGFRAKSIRIDAIGTQGHFRIDAPPLSAIDQAITAFADAGAEVLVTELDVDVLPSATQDQRADLSLSAELTERLNPYTECLPTNVAEQAALRWGALFELFLAHHDAISAVTLWGVSDGHSWLNNWPVNGRTNYALLFDRELRPKTAYQSVVDAASNAP